MDITYRKLTTFSYSIEICSGDRSRVIGFVDHGLGGPWCWVEPKTRDGQKRVRRRRGEFKTLAELKDAVSAWVFDVCGTASESWSKGA